MKNEQQKSNFIISDVISRSIHEAICNDENLKWLYQQKAKVYETIVSKIVITAGYARPLPIDETEHPLLKNINSHIEDRIAQIKMSLNGL